MSFTVHQDKETKATMAGGRKACTASSIGKPSGTHCQLINWLNSPFFTESVVVRAISVAAPRRGASHGQISSELTHSILNSTHCVNYSSKKTKLIEPSGSSQRTQRSNLLAQLKPTKMFYRFAVCGIAKLAVGSLNS